MVCIFICPSATRGRTAASVKLKVHPCRTSARWFHTGRQPLKQRQVDPRLSALSVCLTFGLHALLRGTLTAAAEFGESVIKLASHLILGILMPILYCMAQLKRASSLVFICSLSACEKRWMKKLLYSQRCCLISVLRERLPSLIKIKRAVVIGLC